MEYDDESHNAEDEYEHQQQAIASNTHDSNKNINADDDGDALGDDFDDFEEGDAADDFDDFDDGFQQAEDEDEDKALATQRSVPIVPTCPFVSRASLKPFLWKGRACVRHVHVVS